MKKTHIITISTTLALMLTASAEKGEKKGPKRDSEIPKAVKEYILEKYDTDDDGELSDDEKETLKADIDEAVEERKKNALENFDADDDGKLSKEEREAVRAAKKAQMLKEYDADGDGELSKDEKEAGLKEKLEEDPEAVLAHFFMKSKHGAEGEKGDRQGKGKSGGKRGGKSGERRRSE